MLRITALAAGLPGLVAPAFGTPAGDSPAEREGDIDLDAFYPRYARQHGITGSTRVRLSIDASGRISAMVILSSTPGGMFEQAAEQLRGALRFRPAMAGGKPIASVIETTIAWTLK